MRCLLYCIFGELTLLATTKVSPPKMHTIAVNDCANGMCKRAFITNMTKNNFVTSLAIHLYGLKGKRVHVKVNILNLTIQ